MNDERTSLKRQLDGVEGGKQACQVPFVSKAAPSGRRFFGDNALPFATSTQVERSRIRRWILRLLIQDAAQPFGPCGTFLQCFRICRSLDARITAGLSSGRVVRHFLVLRLCSCRRWRHWVRVCRPCGMLRRPLGLGNPVSWKPWGAPSGPPYSRSALRGFEEC